MSQGSSEVLSVLRSLAIFTAFAFAFYFLLVWNPVGTLGDVRNYLEHRVRVPVEWIVMLVPVAWLLQRNIGYGVATAFLVPIFVVILALTTPDHGAEFWSIFRHEVYLNPVYVPRGLLICFLLLSPMIFTRILVEKREGRRDGDRIRTFVLCLFIGFALTSWEALSTPAPPHTFEGGSGRFSGQWTEVVRTGWGIVTQQIDQHVPPDYRNAATIGASLYPFLALFLLFFPSYRTLPKVFIRGFMLEHREVLPAYLFVGVLVVLSAWAFSAAQGSAHGMGTKFLLGVLSIPAVVAMIVIFLSSIIWVPALLFLLPAWLFWAVSQPFKVAYFLVVTVPIMVLHYLHYLTVPHPVEEVIKQYEAVKSRGAVDYGLFAEKMKGTKYNLRDGIPAWWKSKNLERRLRDLMAVRGRVQAEKNVADEYTEEFRKHHRQEKK